MSIEAGQQLAHYRVVAKLGEGGMGEVWRATDTKLDREVAIKVLPAAFTEDPERLARFEREAKVLAQLQHPNIASIYGLEESDGIRALVMELVEGPTLAERLEEGAIPLFESLAIARQIAEALEDAHEKGIVHRDLKPQNIKASIEGRTKVLDFGLAKAMDPTLGVSGSASQLAASPTLTLGATVQGMILGTAAYMAPEQARGGAVDRRADIWAFGVVLYEMLTGEKLFAADTVPDTLARVLTREPDLARLPDDVPPTIRRLIRRCLVRKPRNRLHAIADARITIEDLLAGRIEEASPPIEPQGIPAATPAWRRATPWLGGALAGIVIASLALSRGGAPTVSASAGAGTIRTLVAAGVSVDPAVSPDGRTLAFGSLRDEQERVWIKDLTSGSESVLGREPSWLPRFSPDGTSVLFMTEENARPDTYRISLATREERLVARDAMEADWSPDGRSAVFLRGYSENTRGCTTMLTIEFEGGREREIYRDSASTMGEPRWSPDGRRIVVALNSYQTGITDRVGVVDVASGSAVEIPLDFAGRPGTKIRGITWISADRLALLLLDSGEQLGSSGRIALLDLETRELRGLLPLGNVGWGLDVAGPGSLIVGVGSTDQNLYEVKRSADGKWGAVELRTEGPFRDRQPYYSPDGKWLLFSSSRSGNLDLWRLSRETGELQRLTDHEADDWDPAMSADGRRLAFSSNRSGRFQIWIADADGSSPRQLTDLQNAQNPTFTPDGEWIVFVQQSAGEEQNGIWRTRLEGSEAKRILAGNFLIPETSPDGGFVAVRGPDGRRIARIEDGALLDTDLALTDRYRWSVESGRTYLWTIGLLDGETEIRRYPFDPARGVLGAPQTILSAGTVLLAESLGVAHDGSAVTFSRFANRRAQLIRIDGLTDLDGR